MVPYRVYVYFVFQIFENRFFFKNFIFHFSPQQIVGSGDQKSGRNTQSRPDRDRKRSRGSPLRTARSDQPQPLRLRCVRGLRPGGRLGDAARTLGDPSPRISGPFDTHNQKSGWGFGSAILFCWWCYFGTKVRRGDRPLEERPVERLVEI